MTKIPVPKIGHFKDQSPVEWLEMMINHSGLTDCKPAFAAIAEYIKNLESNQINNQTEGDPERPLARS